MRTIKHYVKKLSVICFTIFLIASIGCKKDLTETTDITKNKWDLKYINDDDDKLRPENYSECVASYILVFHGDSTFQLSTSVNEAIGIYNIVSKGKIDIIKYQVSSEACCENEFDEKLLLIFKNVNTYKVIGNTLIFYCDLGEVKFKKE
jgi:hypothetical protein